MESIDRRRIGFRLGAGEVLWSSYCEKEHVQAQIDFRHHALQRGIEVQLWSVSIAVSDLVGKIVSNKGR